ALLARQESERLAVVPRMWAKAFNAAAELTFRQGDYQHVAELAERGRAVSRACGDTAGLGRALDILGDALIYLDEHERAQAGLEESLALWRELDDAWGIANSLHLLAVLAQAQGEYARAAALREEGLAQRERRRDPLRDPWLIAYLLNNLGDDVQ